MLLRLARPRLWRRRHGDDEGVAIVLVLGIGLVLSLLTATALTYAVNGTVFGRESQDRVAALAAAQAGVEDYLARLQACPDYYLTGCGEAAGANPALTPTGEADRWSTISGTDPETPARYSYSVLQAPGSTNPNLLLQVKGQVGPETRTLTVQLARPGFLQYIYYTDVEASDPDLIIAQNSNGSISTATSLYERTSGGFTLRSGVSDLTFLAMNGAEDLERLQTECGLRWWERPQDGQSRRYYTQRATWTQGGKSRSGNVYNGGSCDIQFAGGDVISGRMHTNDAILIGGKPRFDGRATSAWPAGATPAPPSWGLYRRGATSDAPDTAGSRPTYGDLIPMPRSNDAIRRQADRALGGQGCLYRGPTEIVFQAGGGYRVTSPRTAGTSGATGDCFSAVAGATVAGPANGVIYVDPDPGATCDPSGRVLGTYPVAGDITRYDCRAGDVFVSGVVRGAYTAASSSDVVVVDDLTYRDDAKDVLGLVATNNVEVYHPVQKCTGGAGCQSGYASIPTGLEDDGAARISAAVLSVNHSFTVQNYDKGVRFDAPLTVFGGIYQRYRGPVGTGAPSGYVKAYSYDPKLTAVPPPAFLYPQGSSWAAVGYSEERSS